MVRPPEVGSFAAHDFASDLEAILLDDLNHTVRPARCAADQSAGPSSTTGPRTTSAGAEAEALLMPSRFSLDGDQPDSDVASTGDSLKELYICELARCYAPGPADGSVHWRSISNWQPSAGGCAGSKDRQPRYPTLKIKLASIATVLVGVIGSLGTIVALQSPPGPAVAVAAAGPTGNRGKLNDDQLAGTLTSGVKLVFAEDASIAISPPHRVPLLGSGSPFPVSVELRQRGDASRGGDASNLTEDRAPIDAPRTEAAATDIAVSEPIPGSIDSAEDGGSLVASPAPMLRPESLTGGKPASLRSVYSMHRKKPEVSVRKRERTPIVVGTDATSKRLLRSSGATKAASSDHLHDGYGLAVGNPYLDSASFNKNAGKCRKTQVAGSEVPFLFFFSGEFC
jgi:hypothetical protein